MLILRTLWLAPFTVLIMMGVAQSADSAPLLDAPEGEQSCSIEGWINNAAGRDVEVRNVPRADATVVGRLPVTRPGEDRYSVRFVVTGSNTGWMRIEGASDRNNADTERSVFSGKGWVPADAVRFQIQSARGFAAPDPNSVRLVDLGDDWATDLGRIAQVLACRGDWALVDLVVERRRDGRGGLAELADDDRSRHRAWFRGICGIEETTCDMETVDVR